MWQELSPDIVTTTGHLEIPLMMAERAWAYAMQRKQETVDAPYRVRRHVVTRLSKAAKVKRPRQEVTIIICAVAHGVHDRASPCSG